MVFLNGKLVKLFAAPILIYVLPSIFHFHVKGRGSIDVLEVFQQDDEDLITRTAIDSFIPKKNRIQIENEKQGSPEWILSNPARNREVEGYMSRSSVKKGSSIQLFYSLNTHIEFKDLWEVTRRKDEEDIPNVQIEVFRTGWYQGIGARKVFGPQIVRGIEQPMPKPGVDGIVQCEWKYPFEILVENDWTTGVYLVKMTELKGYTQSYAIFVVRDDRSSSEPQADVMFQLPVNTYQAYNIWGGINLYRCILRRGCTQARKVSFDRPYAGPDHPLAAFGTGAGEYLSNVQPYKTYPIKYAASWNYNMVRWLEKNGIDVSYVSNVDVHTKLPTLQKPKLFLTQGHDEYWTWAMMRDLMQWRDEGVHLAFLGSNTAYWQIRYENSTSLEEDDDFEYRTVVCYRKLNLDPDKSQYATTKFRQIRPESLLVGVEYHFPLGDPFDEDLVIADTSHWIYNGTKVEKGDKIRGMLGYEVDTIGTDARRIRKDAKKVLKGDPDEPISNIAKIFETPLLDRKNRTIISHGSLYQAKSGAHVFGAGTMQWSWGLDDYGVEQGVRDSRLSTVVEQMTWNFFEATGIQKKYTLTETQNTEIS
ncbi:hypothetical protein CTEN210_13502 [Chaetoceros tenuissimus]|uniref:N,N-dimethylformamidase beta subunit-like C-terminal domain-containing protein n=1 Tax=Chaetoceros tenuissimus TaxID=426638 RepID=A0AAD3D386_9STRA|nr:hypothetical protein CTEN210_13502 [Chaetoceros tenuissimus]